MSIELTSTAFQDGGTIPEEFSKDGGDAFPSLRWTGVPAGTRQLALTVVDPDAPGGRFTHWVLAGLDPALERLDTGEVPVGAVEGRNDFGDVGYGGPQPPEGDPPHRYVFTLYALDDVAQLSPEADYQAFHDAVQGTELARGELTGTFGR